MDAAGTLTGTRVTMDMLAKALSSQLRRPVENMTNVSGVFDFVLLWRPDSVNAADSSRPSLFTALSEQIGVRLEARQLQAVVIVINHLDLTPTAN